MTFNQGSDAVLLKNRYQIKRDSSLSDFEGLISSAVQLDGRTTAFKLAVPSSFTGGLLSDVWAAISLGTLARECKLDVIAAGLQEQVLPDAPIVITPSFLAALSMANEMRSQGGVTVDQTAFRQELAIKARGFIDKDSGETQTIVEFDPDYSVAAILRSGDGFAATSPNERRLIFQHLILQFRRKLEIVARRHGVEPVNEGAAAEVTKFLTELQENSFEHGSRDQNGKVMPGTRLLRLRKYTNNTKAQLLDRCRSFPELAVHVEKSVTEARGPALIEATVSDFGLGIIDSFATSKVAANVQLPNRGELLDLLIYDRLSSKGSDPSAGLGITKALKAARSMGAFVSLRTGEFWRSVSYADDNADPRLQDVAGSTHGRVAGTHWQILWAQQ